MAAGLKTLNSSVNPDSSIHWALKPPSCRIWKTLPKDAGVALTSNQVGGMFGLFFTDANRVTFEDVMGCDVERFKHFFSSMLEEGVYLAPSAFEAGFVSMAHDDEALGAALDAARKVFNALVRYPIRCSAAICSGRSYLWASYDLSTVKAQAKHH